jgi:hypothetical protein
MGSSGRAILEQRHDPAGILIDESTKFLRATCFRDRGAPRFPSPLAPLPKLGIRRIGLEVYENVHFVGVERQRPSGGGTPPRGSATRRVPRLRIAEEADEQIRRYRGLMAHESPLGAGPALARARGRPRIPDPVTHERRALHGAARRHPGPGRTWGTVWHDASERRRSRRGRTGAERAAGHAEAPSSGRSTWRRGARAR